jgi:hypothetical protein
VNSTARCRSPVHWRIWRKAQQEITVSWQGQRVPNKRCDSAVPQLFRICECSHCALRIRGAVFPRNGQGGILFRPCSMWTFYRWECPDTLRSTCLNGRMLKWTRAQSAQSGGRPSITSFEVLFIWRSGFAPLASAPDLPSATTMPRMVQCTQAPISEAKPQQCESKLRFLRFCCWPH